MKTLYSLLILSLSSGLISSAHANDARERSEMPRLELYGEANAAAVEFNKTDGSDSITTVGIGLGGGYFVTPQIEADLVAAYSHISNDGGHSLTFAVGPTFNFSENAEDSPFVGLQLGESMTTPHSNTYNQFVWSVFAGKRFRIASHVTWAPMIGFTKTGEASTGSSVKASTDWNFTVFRFAILL